MTSPVTGDDPDLATLSTALTNEAIADLHKGCTHPDGSAQRCVNLKAVVSAARRWAALHVP